MSPGRFAFLLLAALLLCMVLPSQAAGTLERMHVELQTTAAELVDVLGKRVRAAAVAGTRA